MDGSQGFHLPLVWWTMPRRPALAALLIAACSTDPMSDGKSRWLRIYSDTNYVVSIDAEHIERLSGGFNHRYGMSDVWYRTDHKLPRLHDGREFTREVVHSLVRCDSLWFKVSRVDMSVGDARPFVRQELTAAEFEHQAWRRVVRDTPEEVAAQAACGLAGIGVR